MIRASVYRVIGSSMINVSTFLEWDCWNCWSGCEKMYKKVGNLRDKYVCHWNNRGGKISAFYLFLSADTGKEPQSNEDKSTSTNRNGNDAIGLCGWHRVSNELWIRPGFTQTLWWPFLYYYCYSYMCVFSGFLLLFTNGTARTSHSGRPVAWHSSSACCSCFEAKLTAHPAGTCSCPLIPEWIWRLSG